MIIRLRIEPVFLNRGEQCWGHCAGKQTLESYAFKDVFSGSLEVTDSRRDHQSMNTSLSGVFRLVVSCGNEAVGFRLGQLL